MEGCTKMSNIDPKTVPSFGDEWVRFDQEALGDAKHVFLFNTYFHIFHWDSLPEESEWSDMSCRSGRYTLMVAPKVTKLACIDPSSEALSAARTKLAHFPNTVFVEARVFDQPLPPKCQD
jgi:hypothetical protein